MSFSVQLLPCETDVFDSIEDIEKQLSALYATYTDVEVAEAKEWCRDYGKVIVYNPLDFGAVGDGVTDDSQALQAMYFKIYSDELGLLRRYLRSRRMGT